MGSQGSQSHPVRAEEPRGAAGAQASRAGALPTVCPGARASFTASTCSDLLARTRFSHDVGPPWLFSRCSHRQPVLLLDMFAETQDPFGSRIAQVHLDHVLLARRAWSVKQLLCYPHLGSPDAQRAPAPPSHAGRVPTTHHVDAVSAVSHARSFPSHPHVAAGNTLLCLGPHLRSRAL